MTSLTDALVNTGGIPSMDASSLIGPTDVTKPKAPNVSGLKQFEKDEGKIEVARNERDTAEDDRPKFPTLAPPPKPDTSDDAIKGYTSAIGVLGAVGSIFTRSHMTKSMNAAAAAVRSMQAGDDARFEKDFEAWKVQNDNAFKLLDYQNKVYDSILKNKNLNVDQRIAEMQAHAAMFKDDYMMQLAKDRSIEEMDNHQARMTEAADKASAAAEKIQEGKEKQDIWKQWTKENPNATAMQKADARSRIFDPNVMAADVRAETTKDTLEKKSKPTWDESTIETAARAVAKGVPLAKVVPGFGKDNPNRDAVMNLATKINPNLDLAKAEVGFTGQQQEARTEAGISARVQFAANSLDQSLPLLKDAASKVNLSGFTDLNAVENYVRTHRSDKNMEELLIAAQTSITDYSTLIARNGVRTDATDAAARKLLNANMGRGSIAGFIDQVEKEKKAQLKAAAMTTGRDEDNMEPDDTGIKGNFAPLNPNAIADFKKDIKDNPDKKNEFSAHFEEVFGPGSAKKALGE